MRKCPTPRAFAAVTKSCSLKERNSARTKREVPIQLVRPMTIMMLYILAGRRATTVSIRKKVGKHSIMSTARIIIVSIDMAPLWSRLNHFGSVRLAKIFFEKMEKKI